MKAEEIKNQVAAMRAWFMEGHTLPLNVRKKALLDLKATIMKYESQINDALMADLHKSATETYMCEIGMTLSELSYVASRFKGWSHAKTVSTPLAQFPSSSRIVADPYGVVLVMSPWNYPFMLTMEPVIDAIAAGNCICVKPSAYSPNTSAIIAKILGECFPPQWVSVILGGREENQALLDQKFDYIFFTGGVTVGKEVMAKAAQNLTPVTLELGGKSPVIVDSTADIKLAARRLAFGKLLNCGQTCVAPDYLLIHESVKARFLEELKQCITKQYGDHVLGNPDYVHMVNTKHYERVMGLIDQKKVVFGGHGDPDTLAIEPTILDCVTADDPVMQEEIFGPILPVLTYKTTEEAISFINNRPHPLALYLFSTDSKTQKRFLRSVPFGGGCINDTIMHIATSAMPFGGVGNSGMGSYHGKVGFDTFTHYKSVLKKANWLDLPVRYAPYSSFQMKLLKIFLR